MVTIALDAMGGDTCPKPEVAGAIWAARDLGVRVVLTGPERAVRAELDKHPNWRNYEIEVVPAGSSITMEDSAAKAARSKKDSSMHVAARLVQAGKAQGWVSAGNTGACMAIAKMVQGKVPGVDRPALSGVFPTAILHKPAVMVDVGANVDCTPEMLAQFAIMGEAYSRLVLKCERPKVGLLSIGEEDHKGNELSKATMPILKTLPIHFIGNVEGRDLFAGSVDVIICDGFVGNVALKTAEGLAEMIKGLLRTSMQATTTRKVGAILARSAFSELKKHTDYSEYGGAPLLGLKGVCIICHGRSDANAIKNAIRVAVEFSERNLNHEIEQGLRHIKNQHKTKPGDETLEASFSAMRPTA
jgi:glycerol-3-phosphate acyltransferase PlsX